MQNEKAKAVCKKDCYVESICSRCDFYDGPEDDLECAAYRILVRLVEDGTVKLSEISDARIKERGE